MDIFLTVRISTRSSLKPTTVRDILIPANSHSENCEASWLSEVFTPIIFSRLVSPKLGLRRCKLMVAVFIVWGSVCAETQRASRAHGALEEKYKFTEISGLRANLQQINNKIIKTGGNSLDLICPKIVFKGRAFTSRIRLRLNSKLISTTQLSKSPLANSEFDWSLIPPRAAYLWVCLHILFLVRLFLCLLGNILFSAREKYKFTEISGLR